MSDVTRTTVYERMAGDVRFAVERWWMPVDSAEESLIRIALVWCKDDVEHVALLGPGAAAEVIHAVMEIAVEAAA